MGDDAVVGPTPEQVKQQVAEVLAAVGTLEGVVAGWGNLDVAEALSSFGLAVLRVAERATVTGQSEEAAPPEAP